MKQLTALFLVLALSFGMTGCGETTVENRVEETPSPQTQSPAPAVKPSAPVSQPKPERELPELLETISDPVALSIEQAEAFHVFLGAQRPEYEFFGLYDFEAALAAWAEMPSYTAAETELLRNGMLNKDVFLNQVKQNNAAFLAVKKGNKYAALSDDEFEKVCSIVCDGVDVLLRWGTDELLLDEKLGNLKSTTFCDGADTATQAPQVRL